MLYKDSYEEEWRRDKHFQEMTRKSDASPREASYVLLKIIPNKPFFCAEVSS
jgi:hypothetical protein